MKELRPWRLPRRVAAGAKPGTLDDWNTMGPMHKQLLGKWKSAKHRTLRTFGPFQHFSRSKQRRVGAIFGKLTVRYTPRFCFITLDGVTTRERYEVIAEDADSIVVRAYSDQSKKRVDPIILRGCESLFDPKLQHLHFETIRGRDYYWLGIRVLVEWFVRQRPAKRRRAPRPPAPSSPGWKPARRG